MVQYRHDAGRKVTIVVEEDGFVEKNELHFNPGGNQWRGKLDHNGQASWEKSYYGREIDVAFQALNELVDKHSKARQTRVGADRGRHVPTLNRALGAEAPVIPTPKSYLYGGND